MQLKNLAAQRVVTLLAPWLAAGVVGLVPALAEIESDLSPIVISATRMPTALPRVGSALSIVDVDALQQRGVYDLQSALGELPGVMSTSTAGARGAIGSLFIRGTSTSDSQLIVDGVRLSDATVPLGNFLGTSTLDGFEQIEVLRGPQSALYGGEAVGGVVSLTTRRGQAPASAQLRAEGGSFGSYSASQSYSGVADGLRYFLSGHYEHTDNELPNNEFSQGGAVLRLDRAVNPTWDLGMTARFSDSSYADRGNSLDHLDSSLVTLFSEARVTPVWTSRAVLGRYQESYDSDSSYGNYGTDLERLSGSLDNQIELGARHRLALGGFFETTDFANTIGTQASRDRYGFHTGWEWQATDALTTYLAGRWEDYAAYGNELTYRGTLAYQLRKGTLLRTSYGRAFKTPTYLDLFGSDFGAGNPSLKAQSSHGWDLGVEQTVAKNHTLAMTWFANRVRDQINSSASPPVNQPGTSETRGIEAELRGQIGASPWSYRATYTFLDRALRDLPKNTATAGVTYQPTTKWLYDMSATYVDTRSYGGNPLDAYLVARLAASYQATRQLKLHARIENLFDADYELSDFYGDVIPARGIGLFTGMTYQW